MADNMQIVPTYQKNVEAQYVEMMVPLYSYGCEKKIKKALSHLKGIYSVNVDFNLQKVTVWGICNRFDVLRTVKSKRKDARFWNSGDNCEEEQCVGDKRKKLVSSSLLRSLSWRVWKKTILRSTSFQEKSPISSF